MRVTWLRKLARNYGISGLTLAGVVLLGHYLWTRRRVVLMVLLALLSVLIAGERQRRAPRPLQAGPRWQPLPATRPCKPPLPAATPLVNIPDQPRYRWCSNGKLLFAEGTLVDLKGARMAAIRTPESCYDGIPSPDGKWILFRKRFGAVAFSLEGEAVVRRNTNSPSLWVDVSDRLWLPDSREWVALFFGNRAFHAVVQGLASPRVVADTSLGIPKDTPHGWDVPRFRLLGTTRGNRIIAVCSEVFARSGSRDMPLFSFHPAGYWPDVHSWTIRLPYHPESMSSYQPDEGAALSPSGDRLAWALDVKARPPARTSSRSGRATSMEVTSTASAASPLQTLTDSTASSGCRTDAT